MNMIRGDELITAVDIKITYYSNWGIGCNEETMPCILQEYDSTKT